MIDVSDVIRTAKEKLKGRLFISALLCFVAALLGAEPTGGGGGGGGGNSGTGGSGGSSSAIQSVVPQIDEKWMALISMLMLILLIWALITLIIGGAVLLGMKKYFLNIAAGAHATFSDLFSYVKNKKWDGFALTVLVAIKTILWTLLFIIPGIIASFRYMLAPYIMAEDPSKKATESIEESKRLTYGHKGKLFEIGLRIYIPAILLSVVLMILLGAFAVTLMRAADGTAGGGNVLALMAGVVVFGLILSVISFILKPQYEAAIAEYYSRLKVIDAARYQQTNMGYQQQNQTYNQYDENNNTNGDQQPPQNQ